LSSRLLLLHALRSVPSTLEALGSDAPLHLAEMGLGGGLVSVSADPSEVGVPLEALHQVLDVGYLEELAEHEGFEVPLGLVLHGPPRAFSVEVCPEDGLDRS